MKKRKQLLFTTTLFIMAGLLLTGCTTTKLWSDEQSKHYVLVKPEHPGEDVETVLKASGRHYFCKPTRSSIHGANKVCYMAESEALTLQQKIIYTPEALAIDIIAPVVVTAYFVGFITLEMKMNDIRRQQTEKQVREQTEHPNGL